MENERIGHHVKILYMGVYIINYSVDKCGSCGGLKYYWTIDLLPWVLHPYISSLKSHLRSKRTRALTYIIIYPLIEVRPKSDRAK